jgi:hypothetical protein
MAKQPGTNRPKFSKIDLSPTLVVAPSASVPVVFDRRRFESIHVCPALQSWRPDVRDLWPTCSHLGCAIKTGQQYVVARTPTRSLVLCSTCAVELRLVKPGAIRTAQPGG